MALRLRRGTDSERQLITPVEGELIYTTDTKLLYAGDGSTAGGTLVTGAGGGGSTTLNALTDTDLTGASNSDVLTYNSSSSKWESTAVPGLGVINLTDINDVYIPSPNLSDVLKYDGITWRAESVNNLITAGSNLNTNIVGDDSTIMVNVDTNTFTGNLTGNVTGRLTGNVSDSLGVAIVDVTNRLVVADVFGTLDGDVNGSVFGDDSTLLVDSVDGKIVGDIETTQLVVRNATELVAEFKSISGVDISFIDVNVSNGTFNSPTTVTAGDSGGGIRSKSWDGSQYKMNMALGSVHTGSANFADDYPAADTYLITAGGTTTALWTFKSDKTLVAPGPIQPGVYADNTARDAAITTPTAGMMVFNTTGTKFQGYTGSAWVDLN
jgi:hypothetical protein